MGRLQSGLIPLYNLQHCAIGPQTTALNVESKVMRNDALGFFWNDEPIVKVLKAKAEKKQPPEAVWESPSYLPGLAEALTFKPPELTYTDLITAPPDEELLFDVEVYPNYFLCSFGSLRTGKVMSFELSPWSTFDKQALTWVYSTYCVVGFNSIKYDAIMVHMAIAGCTTEQMWWATDQMINYDIDGREILKKFKIRKIKANHIDLIEVAPLRASLKIYGGRLHSHRMQDLPFKPGTVLSFEQAAITRYYNIRNDIATTALLRNSLNPQIALRYEMSNEYGVDLRSKSDAQIAETVISAEIFKLTGLRPRPPEIAVGTVYKYNVPSFLRYQSPLMQWVLDEVANADFMVGEFGSVVTPPCLQDLKVKMGASEYTMGIGGLHSCESTIAHRADKHYTLRDRDVVSFYPKIILNQMLYPQHLGVNFLKVYGTIVDRRIHAKRQKWKSIAESLKIVINGSYGKLGSKYSVLYAPDLLVQVTMTGQLVLLMLVERLEMAGISVVSANTDGIVIRVHTSQEALYESIIAQWERDTNFETEETQYLALYSRDINNYIAVKTPDDKGKVKCKTKGAFANPWADNSNFEPWMHKNPTNQICVDAIEALLTTGISLEATIQLCKDITKFVSVRSVTGGAVKVEKDGAAQYLGKSIRWYYSTAQRDSEFVYAKSGNKVPRSDGAQPIMDIPSTFPNDVDYERYIAEAQSMLIDIGYA